MNARPCPWSGMTDVDGYAELTIFRMRYLYQEGRECRYRTVDSAPYKELMVGNPVFIKPNVTAIGTGSGSGMADQRPWHPDKIKN